MAVPKFHELMRPLLELLSDGRTRPLRDAGQAIARKLELTEADLAETVPSGYPKFIHRLSWAKHDLSKAGLIETTGRGVFRITDFGMRQLPSLPNVIDRAFLTQKGWGTWGQEEKISKAQVEGSFQSEETPDERIDAAFSELENSLAQEVLSRLKLLNPDGFERFVVELLTAMGYGIGEVTGRTGDGGIDGVIYEDRLKLDRIFLQAKKWADNPVRSPDINGFIGALARQGASRGVFVTTSRYTPDARDAADVAHLRVVLIDGLELSKLAIEYNVGVSLKRKLEIKRLDSDYFDEL